MQCLLCFINRYCYGGDRSRVSSAKRFSMSESFGRNCGRGIFRYVIMVDDECGGITRSVCRLNWLQICRGTVCDGGSYDERIYNVCRGILWDIWEYNRVWFSVYGVVITIIFRINAKTETLWVSTVSDEISGSYARYIQQRENDSDRDALR